MLTPKQAAATIDGREYCEEINADEIARLRESGLVVVYGASDDLIEFRGAWYEEEYGPKVVHVNERGPLQSRCEEGADCPYFKDTLANARTIEAVFDEEGFTWVYRTDIPHETFVIMEDSDTYCRGIVFAASDAA